MDTLMDTATLEKYLPAVLDFGINILFAIIILTIGSYVASKVNTLICATGERHERLDSTLFKFLGSVARYVILAFVLLAVLNRFGVQTASIIALLGAAGLAVGLALQGTLSNVAAGVMLLVFRPYKVGDFINAADRFGKVEAIDLFTTELQTFDRQQIIIPNSQIWGNQIVNHSHHGIRGVDMRFGVAYKARTEAAREVIRAVLARHPQVLDDPAPFIEVETLNESSVDFLVRPFCHGEHYFDVLYSVPEQVKNALDEAGIEIPFPHRKLIIEKQD
jgi:small conductance mechanosensitive channel